MRSRDEEDSAPTQSKAPPAWMINVGKTVLVGAFSTLVGMLTAAWNVRGSLDEAKAHQEKTDLKIDNLTQNVTEIRQDLRELLRAEVSGRKQ